MTVPVQQDRRFEVERGDDLLEGRGGDDRVGEETLGLRSFAAGEIGDVVAGEPRRHRSPRQESGVEGVSGFLAAVLDQDAEPDQEHRGDRAEPGGENTEAPRARRATSTNCHNDLSDDSAAT
ncbi:MAG TPA: hypothetical protein VF640_09905 [Acidimicrobiales bacterium]